MMTAVARVATVVAGRHTCTGPVLVRPHCSCLVFPRLRTPGLGALGAAACRPLQFSTSGLQVRAASGNGASASSASSGSAVDYDFDLFTIGAGSGGTRASRVAAGTYGAKVAVCELPFGTIASETTGGAGGTCVLRGCVPKKLFVFAGSFTEDFRDARGFGWDLPEVNSIDWPKFLEKKNAELRRLNGVYNNLLANSGVTFIEGRGRVVGPHEVEVNGKCYTAKHILIAVGGKAQKLPIEGGEHTIISDQILEIPAIPKKLLVIGSGYIGLEFAGIFNNLGSEVHVFFRGEKPLTGFDNEIRTFAAEQYVQRGMKLHPGYSPTRITKNEDGSLTMYSKSKSGEEVVETADVILMATGRKPNTKTLGLEEVGVELVEKTGAIKVNEYSRSSVSSIWAIGDVTDRMNLTPVALMEGMALTRHLFGGEDAKPDHESIATAVFSSPPIADVGLTEEQAKEVYGDIDIYTSSFRPMKNTISGNEGKALMKIIVAADTDKVVGVHMVGPEAAEIMQGLAVAVKMGVTKKQLDSVVGIHPSSAEEFVTMRSPTRQIRKETSKEVAAAA